MSQPSSRRRAVPASFTGLPADFIERFDAEPPVGQPKTAASPSDPFGTDTVTADVDDADGLAGDQPG